MKHLFLYSLFIPFFASAQQNDVIVKSEVKEVILYQSSVQEVRQAKLTLNEGNHLLKFTGLPNSINPASIQVKGVNNFTILSINYQQNYLQDQEIELKSDPLQDSIKSIKHEIDYRKTLIIILNEEKNMLRANRKLVNNNGLTVDDLKEISEFSSDRIHNIDLEINKINKEIEKLNTSSNKLNQQLAVETTGKKLSTGEILVNISAKNKINGLVQIAYVTGNAGWSPFYDIRANEVGGPVSVSYKANVYQQCGSDWQNVKLTLSTAQPNTNNSKPIVPIWYINFYSPSTRYSSYGALSNSTHFNLDEKSTGGSGTYSWNTPVNTINQNAINTEFQISTPYTIPTDGKSYVVEIGSYEFPATYNYSAIPKLAKEAFLMAGITGWYAYTFLPAPSNIYYKGTFVGKSYLNTETSSDTLDISMGSDESVIIKRKNISEVNSKNISGNTKKVEEKFEITIRNTKSIAISIEIEDQVPVSKQKEITVDVNETSGAEWNKESGKLKWKLNLEPNATKTLIFSYLIKYPKNYIIDNL